MINLSEINPSFPDEIAFCVDEISRAPVPALGKLCEALVVLLRTAGVAALLVDFDADGFQHMLIRSALTRAHLLERVPPADRDASRYCKISRASGFLDAVACAHLDLARRIVRASPKQRNPRFEYEEEYAWARFLHGIVEGEAAAVQTALLDDWKALLDGAKSAKLEVGRALLGGDPAVFDGAFTGLLTARKAEILAQERSLTRDEMEYAGGRYVYVEGLAVLRLAEGVGIATRPEYLYCPAEARTPMVTPFPNDLYPQ